MAGWLISPETTGSLSLNLVNCYLTWSETLPVPLGILRWDWPEVHVCPGGVLTGLLIKDKQRETYSAEEGNLMTEMLHCCSLKMKEVVLSQQTQGMQLWNLEKARMAFLITRASIETMPLPTPWLHSCESDLRFLTPEQWNNETDAVWNHQLWAYSLQLLSYNGIRFSNVNYRLLLPFWSTAFLENVSSTEMP